MGPTSVSQAADTPAFPLTEDAIRSRTWSLSRSDRGLVARHVRFLPSGYIGSGPGIAERRWEMADGHLSLIDELGRRSAVFAWVRRGPGEKLVLIGDLRAEPGVSYVLEERQPLSRIADDDGSVRLEFPKPFRRRRNLVVVRANEKSLHTQWPRDIADGDRNWDLCVSWYGDAANFPPPDFAECHVLQNADRKFLSLHKLLHTRSPLWGYDYLYFIDDDVMISWSGINRMFEVSLEHELDLAQAALSRECFFNQDITVRDDGCLLRYVDFVESMAPLFSRQALEVCAPTFAMCRYGWGIDIIWPGQLGSRRNKVAVVDAVISHHTRPMAVTYEGAVGAAEMRRVLADYGHYGQVDQGEGEARAYAEYRCVFGMNEYGAVLAAHLPRPYGCFPENASR